MTSPTNSEGGFSAFTEQLIEEPSAQTTNEIVGRLKSLGMEVSGELQTEIGNVIRDQLYDIYHRGYVDGQQYGGLEIEE